MKESAEYFLAGFFGLGWAQNATLELVIEWDGFNNTMAGYKKCNNSNWDTAYEGLFSLTKGRRALLIVNSFAVLGEDLPC